MTQISERHIRLIKKDQELGRLFEEAARRRKKLLLQKNEAILCTRKESGQSERPLRRSYNLVTTDKNDNQIEIYRDKYVTPQRNSVYLSHQNLQETNLDLEEVHPQNSIQGPNNNTCTHENVPKSSHHNLNFVTYSSSSSDVDTCNYCQFIPTTLSSTNNTISSSHYSKMDNSSAKLSSLGPSSSDGGTHSERDIDDNTQSVRYIDGNGYKLSSVVFYPSGSPLISHRYQGSPVVRIDDKLRAGEADCLIKHLKSALGKPPLIPPHQKLHQTIMTCLGTTETRLSHPVLLDINECDNGALSFQVSTHNPNHNVTTVIRRTKKKMLEEHMRKRFSVGDYSTRALIEFENNLNCTTIEQLSVSGDLAITTAIHSEESTGRYMSSHSDCVFAACHNLDSLTTEHNISPEVDILHESTSPNNFRDPQVSFSLNKDKPQTDQTRSRDSDRFFRGTNFIRRSMNDIATALKSVTEKTPSSRRAIFNGTHFSGYGMFKKRDSSSNDLLYSVPPFARKHMPPDISGATRLLSQETYQDPHLPSSTPNLIAELDPTFHERYPLESSYHDSPSTRQWSGKRNRSYRLSFIENADIVTTKKLTGASLNTSPSNDTVLRFVQPRRRLGSRSSAMVKRQDSPKMEPRNGRSRSSHRFSCATQ